MKPRKLDTAISFALSNRTQAIIAQVAEEGNLSLGEAARELLTAEIEVKGIKVSE